MAKQTRVPGGFWKLCCKPVLPILDSPGLILLTIDPQTSQKDLTRANVFVLWWYPAHKPQTIWGKISNLVRLVQDKVTENSRVWFHQISIVWDSAEVAGFHSFAFRTVLGHARQHLEKCEELLTFLNQQSQCNMSLLTEVPCTCDLQFHLRSLLYYLVINFNANRPTYIKQSYLLDHCWRSLLMQFVNFCPCNESWLLIGVQNFQCPFNKSIHSCLSGAGHTPSNSLTKNHFSKNFCRNFNKWK